MTDKIELKPCPFCGKMAFWDSDFSGIYCRCGAEFTFFESDKEAAERWNSRPIEDALKAENKRLREALEVILDALQGEKVCIPALRIIAYTALKDKDDGSESRD